jgi:arylsulfatase A-like enzyme
MRCPTKPLAVLVLGLLLVPPVGAEGKGNLRAKPRPNILLVTVDTLRANRLGCYGGTAVPTPNIDRLAERGTLFARAFAPTPLTLPSHATILLGMTPLAHGVHDNIDFVVRPEHTTLAEILKANGYQTAAVVSASPLDSRFGLAQGFDLYDDTFMAPGSPKTSPAEQKAEVTVDKALRWLRSAANGPWFLWIHIWDPHSEYAPPEPFRTQYKDRLYDGEVAYTDLALGRLFRHLEENQLAERTLTVLTADHGEGLGDHEERTHGYLVHNATIWVPLIVAAPGLQTRQYLGPVTHSDIVPTLLDVLGIAPPPGVQGRSLRAALAGKSVPPAKIYIECLSPYYELGWAPLRGYIDGDEKFVQAPLPEVYDLAKDFGERKNLAPAVRLDPYQANLERLVTELTPAVPPDAQARTSPELKEKLQSLGYLARSGPSSRSSFTADDDPKTLLPLLNRITDAYDLQAAGKRAEAIRRLESIVKEPRTLDAAYIHLADLHMEAGNRARALEVLAAGWRRFPMSYELLSSYTGDLVTTERWMDVVRVVGEGGNLPQMDHDGILWFLQGLAYQRLGDVPGSVAAFEKAVAADGEYLAALFNLGAAHLSLYFQSGVVAHLDRAASVLQRAVGLDPRNAEAQTLLGRAYLEARQADRAIASLEMARRLRPDLVNVEYQLGLAFLDKRDFARARAHLVAFKDKAYGTLSVQERVNLDQLIQKVVAALR